MTSSFLKGQLWIWGLMPTDLQALGGPGAHIWKTSLFLFQTKNELGGHGLLGCKWRPEQDRAPFPDGPSDSPVCLFFKDELAQSY